MRAQTDAARRPSLRDPQGYALVNEILFPLVEASDVVKQLEEPYPDWKAALGVV